MYKKTKRFIATAVTTVTAVTLVGCGTGDTETIAKVGGKDFTNADYIEVFNDSMDKELKQSLFIDNVVASMADEERTDKIYNSYLDTLEKSDPELKSSLTDEEKTALKEGAEKQSGMIEILKETDIATDKLIKEKYDKNNKQAVISSVIIPSNSKVNAKDVENILRDNNSEEDIKDSLGKLDKELNYETNTEYNQISVPEELEKVFKKKSGDVFTADMAGVTAVIKVDEVTKVPLKEVEDDVVLHIGQEKISDNSEFLSLLEDKGVVDFKKPLREYLQLDEIDEKDDSVGVDDSKEQTDNNETDNKESK